MSGRRQSVVLRISADGTLETKQLNGRDHLVVPAVILVEGVLWSSNAPHPALALSSEFGIFPEGWDGRPVVYNHPKKNGTAVSANLPDLWDSEVIGQMFSSVMKGTKKLATHMWLDKEKTPSEVFETLEAGESLEVSTGLYALEEDKEGEYEGQEYKVIWRNITPDHLAVLPKGSIGACSIEDGCGAPRVNQSRQGASVTTPNTQETTSAAAPAAAPAANAQPAAAASTPTATAAAAAPTPAAAVTVVNCSGCQGQRKMVTDNLRANIGKLFTGVLESVGFKISELSDVDKRVAIEAALAATYSEDFYCYVMALYAKEVIYQCLDMSEGYEWKTYKRAYKVAEGGKITLGSEIVEVRAETKFVPLEIAVNSVAPAAIPPTTEGTSMSTTTTTPAGAAAAAAAAPAPAPAANAQEAAAAVAAAAAASAAATAAVAAAAQAAQPQTQKAKSLTELAEHADESTKALLNSLLAQQTARKDALVKALEGKIGLGPDELKALPVENLEKMAGKLNVMPADFSAAAPAAAPAAPAANTEKNFTPAPRVFEAPGTATRQ